MRHKLLAVTVKQESRAIAGRTRASRDVAVNIVIVTITL